MSAARFFIPSLPGQPSDASVTMYGGHIPSAPPKNGVPDTESDAHLYFYLVRNKHIAETERTLLWSVPRLPPVSSSPLASTSAITHESMSDVLGTDPAFTIPTDLGEAGSTADRAAVRSTAA